MNEKQKLLVICGSTATGKTKLGIYLAKKFGGEIVSADSRQVYKYMDIGTGKDLPVISNFQFPISNLKKLGLGCYIFKGIPVWMLDVVRPNQEFSVADYVDLARKVINNIWKRKKLPIVVGGTGFYIKGLVDGIETLGTPPDWKLRRRLELLSVQELFEMLARLDSEKAVVLNASDRKNPRRLVRAIEVAFSNKKPETPRERKDLGKHGEGVLFVGLMASYKELYKRIDKRIDDQVRMGAEKEIKNLLKQGYTWDLPAMTAMGYGVWEESFRGKKSKKEVIKRWKYDEHGFSRRQMTWFRKDKRINWLDITSKNWQDKVEQLVGRWYNFSRANKS